MLPRLAYLTLCASIQLLMLAVRGEPPRTWNVSSCVTSSACSAAKSRPKLEPTDRAMLAALSRALPRARWSCFFVKPETLLGIGG